MADLINRDDDLNTGREKLNEAIKDANKAKQESEEALQTANQSLAQSKNTQTQLDQIVIEGDSSVEAAQARVDAEGKSYSTLKARLDEKETQFASQLAQTTSQQKQKDFFGFHERNQVDIYPNTYNVLGDRRIVFNVGIAENENIEHEFRKNPLDDFIKHTTSKLNKVSFGIVKENLLTENITTGSMTGMGSTANIYTTVIGTTITKQFTGTAIYFNHFTDDRGGLWECKIDGVFVKNLSTHINAVPSSELNVSVGRRLIAEGLTNEQHTLTMEFKGEDPNNPPSGTARGWARVNDGTNNNPDLNRETFEVLSEEMTQTEILSNSNKEFAFRAKEQGASYSAEWMPEHNGKGSAFVGSGGFQEIYIDGKIINSSQVVSNQSFNEAKIVQKLEFLHPFNSVKLGTLLFTTTINHKGIAYTGKMLWEKDVTITAGYVNMFTLNPQFAKKLVSSFGNQYDLTIADGSLEDINEVPFGFIALNPNEPNYYVYMQSFATNDTLRLDKTGRRGKTDGTGLYFLQHRDATLQKLYPQTYSNHNATTGEVYYFEGHIGFGKHPRVAELFID